MGRGRKPKGRERAEEGDGGRAEEQEEREEVRTFTLDNTVRCKELPDL